MKVLCALCIASMFAVAQDQAPSQAPEAGSSRPAGGSSVHRSSTITRTRVATGKPRKFKTPKVKGGVKFKRPKTR